MKLLKSKSGKLNSKGINAIVLGIIILVVLLSVVAALMPEAQDAGDLLNDTNRCNEVSGCSWNTSQNVCVTTANHSNACATGAQTIPLGNLFSGTAAMFVIIMAAIFLFVIKGIFTKNKK